MKLTRRDLLIRTAAATILLPACRGGVRIADGDTALDSDTDTGLPDSDVDTGWSWEPGPEPEVAWEPEAVVDLATFAWGVQTGDAEATSAIAQVQTTAETASLRIARGTDAGWEELDPVEGLVADAGVVRVELTGLVPDTTYALYFEAGGVRSPVARLRTALYPGARRVVRFGATSCIHEAHAPWPSLTHAAAEKLDFFALLGDTIYADGGEGDLAWFEGLWRDALATEGLQAVALSTSLVSTWDDHEIHNDWGGVSDGADRQQAALTAFRRAIPQRDGAEGVIWRKLAWGDAVELFVLDCRGERDGERYVSTEQMTWLKDSLTASTARFKIIVNSVPITDWSDTVLWDWVQDDRWQGHEAQREEILGHIHDTGIAGVLWITGDHHFGGITHVDASGGSGAEQMEVLCGPAGSSINTASWLLQENDRYPSIVRTYNWVRFECDPDAGTIQVSFVDDDGDVVSTLVLSV